MKHFFGDWDRINKNINGKHLFLLLDYDGTLTPIVERPEKAMLDQAVKGLLKKLSAHPQCSIAIISGRELEDIRSKVGLKNIIYAGNHGFQIMGPKLRFNNKPAEVYRKLLEKIKEKLEEPIAAVPGAFLEDKGFTLALHYRNVARKNIVFIAHVFREYTKEALSKQFIKISKGKKVLEIRPPVLWNKGTFALWLLTRKHSVYKNHRVVPIYIGDDTTDEDAFKALTNKGITVVVGKRRVSRARYFVNSTRDVKKILMNLEQVLQGKRHA